MDTARPVLNDLGARIRAASDLVLDDRLARDER
jgi:hypothetical protein